MSLTPATAQTLRSALATVVVVPVTPFRADGSPDWDTYAALTGRLIDGGITAITPNGNTGEFYALSPAEARQAVETAAKAQRPGRDCRRRRPRHRRPRSRRPGTPRDHGARMVMVHQPVHPYVSGEGWIDYHAAIAERRPRPRRGAVRARRARITGAQIAELARPGAERGRRQVLRAATRAVRRRGQGRRARPVRPGWPARPSCPRPPTGRSGATASPPAWPTSHPEIALAMLDALRADDFAAAMKVWESVAPVRGAAPGRLLAPTT